MDAGNVICDEAWYNSVSLLGDLAGSDNDDNDYSSVSRGPLLEDVIGGTNAAPCKDAVFLVDTMQRLQSIADAEACQGEKNGRAWRRARLGLSWALSRATRSSRCRSPGSARTTRGRNRPSSGSPSGGDSTRAMK